MKVGITRNAKIKTHTHTHPRTQHTKTTAQAHTNAHALRLTRARTHAQTHHEDNLRHPNSRSYVTLPTLPVIAERVCSSSPSGIRTGVAHRQHPHTTQHSRAYTTRSTHTHTQTQTQTQARTNTNTQRHACREATPRGFEPLRAEPNGFRVHLLNRSDTLSLRIIASNQQQKKKSFHCAPREARTPDLEVNSLTL